LDAKIEKRLQIVTKKRILCHYYQQKTIDEIAFITAQTAANVKVKLFRIRKKLYNMMRYE